MTGCTKDLNYVLIMGFLGGLAYIPTDIRSAFANGKSQDGHGKIHTVTSWTNAKLLGCKKPLYTRDKRSSANPGVLVERERNERKEGIGEGKDDIGALASVLGAVSGPQYEVLNLGN